MRFMLAPLIALAAIPTASAQQSPAPAPERVALDKLSAQLLGSWQVEIREYDEAGAVKWRDEQVRVFTRGFLGNAVEERAYKPPRLAPGDNFGLQILLLQRPGFRMTHYGIWPGAAARIFIVEGELRRDGSGFDGVMTATDEQGAEDKRRVVMEWLAPAVHAYRVYSRTAQGREYLREELIYRRPA